MTEQLSLERQMGTCQVEKGREALPGGGTASTKVQERKVEAQPGC